VCAVLKKAGLLEQVPPSGWKKTWAAQCKTTGRGEQVLDHLGRYSFRVAIPNTRLERIADGQVTFHYRVNRTQKMQRVTLLGMEFLHRFLQHVLPPGCTMVRYYGVWRPTCRGQLAQARRLLSAPPPAAAMEPAVLMSPVPPAPPPLPARSPHCQVGPLILVEVLRHQRSQSP
jgi:hypothetical protein